MCISPVRTKNVLFPAPTKCASPFVFPFVKIGSAMPLSVVTINCIHNIYIYPGWIFRKLLIMKKYGEKLSLSTTPIYLTIHSSIHPSVYNLCVHMCVAHFFHKFIFSHAHSSCAWTNPASCMCPPPSLSPSCMLLSCPLFSSWWQNEFAYFSGSTHYNALTGHLPASWAGCSFLLWHLWCKMRQRQASITSKHEVWVWVVIGIWNQFTLLIIQG